MYPHIFKYTHTYIIYTTHTHIGYTHIYMYIYIYAQQSKKVIFIDLSNITIINYIFVWYVHIHVHMYYLHIHMYIHVYTCIHIYICIYTQQSVMGKKAIFKPLYGIYQNLEGAEHSQAVDLLKNAQGRSIMTTLVQNQCKYSVLIVYSYICLLNFYILGASCLLQVFCVQEKSKWLYNILRRFLKKWSGDMSTLSRSVAAVRHVVTERVATPFMPPAY